MHKIWSLGLANLKPGLLRFFSWTKDSTPHTQKQTHILVWIRLLDLPQEYWRPKTLLEIASGVGTPLTIDESTKARLFGHYARILVDIDLSCKLYNNVLVERDGHAFKVAIVYEKYPNFCNNCRSIGHSIQNCQKLVNSNPIVQKNLTKAFSTAITTKNLAILC